MKTPEPENPNPPRPSVRRASLIHSIVNSMKFPIILILISFLVSCGPDRAQLRAELSSIESELAQISSAAQQHRSAMSEAEVDSFIGSFAAGYGAVSGDGDLVGDGAATAARSIQQYDHSSDSLEQLRRRYDSLSKHRDTILSVLR